MNSNSSTTPASEALADTPSSVLSDAEREERESHRVRSEGTEAWDTYEGDSQSERDYTPEELGVDLAPTLTPFSGAIYAATPELLVETTVSFPDGRRVVFSEARECAEANDGDALDLVRKVNRSADFRFAW